jgi:hypothetical protein
MGEQGTIQSPVSLHDIKLVQKIPSKNPFEKAK